MGSTIGAFWGGQSYISVWNIKLEDNGTDFVSSYMSVGHRSPANTNNLEVGWHVSMFCQINMMHLIFFTTLFYRHSILGWR